MYPILFRIFNIPVYSYGFFLALAFFVGLMLILKKSASLGIDKNLILDLVLYIIISSVVGARLLHVGLDFNYYIKHPLEIFLLNRGGLVFYGGFILALVTGIIFIKRRRLPVLKTVDLIIAYLPLGQAIGRIGCFLNGCCYGKETSGILAIRFPGHSFAAEEFGVNHFVYPAQIYSSFVDLFIFVILMIRMRRKNYDGQIAVYYMFLYGSMRFLLEYVRADNPVVFYGLNVPQLISICLIVFALFTDVIKSCRN